MDDVERDRIIACGSRMLKAAEPDTPDIVGTAAIDILSFYVCQSANDLPQALEGLRNIVADLSVRIAANFAPNTKGKNNVN